MESIIMTNEFNVEIKDIEEYIGPEVKEKVACGIDPIELSVNKWDTILQAIKRIRSLMGQTCGLCAKFDDGLCHDPDWGFGVSYDHEQSECPLSVLYNDTACFAKGLLMYDIVDKMNGVVLDIAKFIVVLSNLKLPEE
jgi:hypothetical protein